MRRATAEVPLVGRRSEMAAAQTALDRALAGEGSVLVLSGEPGIGKTRLAREALAAAESLGFECLSGRAFQSETALAFAPFLEALNPLLRRDASLCEGLAALGRVFPHLGLSPLPSSGDPALDRTLLYEAFTRLFERASAEVPVTLLLDDLHWADASSRELVRYVGRDLTRLSLLIIVTYRSGEVGSRDIADLCGPLVRDGTATELHVPRLDHAGVTQLAHALLDGEPPAALMRLLELRAAGTPLFVEAIIDAEREAAHLIDIEGRWSLVTIEPTASATRAHDVIRERLRRLDPSERELLDIIAVDGGATTFRILVTAAGTTDDAAFASLLVLERAGLVDEEASERDVAYSLSHPLYGEVAVADMSTLARRRLHTALAAATEAHRPHDVERLARHYLASASDVDVGRALDALVLAGERAANAFAHAEAIRYLEAARNVIDAGRREELRPRVLEKLGDARVLGGSYVDAIADWEQALTACVACGDHAAVARIHTRLANSAWAQGDFEAAFRHLDSGDEVLAGLPPTDDLADLLGTRVDLAFRRGRVDEVAETATRLERVARLIGSDRAVLRARIARLWSLATQQVDDRYGPGELALAEAERLGDPLLANEALRYLTAIALAMGDHRRVIAYADRAADSAEKVGAGPITGTTTSMRVFAEIAAGEWDLAESDAETMIRRAGGTVYDPRRVGAAGLRSVVHTLRGEVEEAARVLRDATEGGPVTTRVDFGAFGMYMLGIGMLAAAGGQFDMIAVALVELGAQFGTLTPPPLSILTEPEVVAARPTEIQAITSSLATTFGPANRLVRALDARVRGLAAEARGEPDAAGPLAEAAELFAGLAMPFDRARTLLDLGRVQRDPEPALEALTIFDHLGARLYGERTRELLRSLGVRPPPRRRQPKTTGTLSARELDVARLVAGGMSNREIAASLVVSVRTVTSHLDHMYAKLGIRSRATLTRYVIERGLVT